LGAKLFGRAQEVDRGRVLAAHGVRAGQVEVHLWSEHDDLTLLGQTVRDCLVFGRAEPLAPSLIQTADYCVYFDCCG